MVAGGDRRRPEKHDDEEKEDDDGARVNDQLNGCQKLRVEREEKPSDAQNEQKEAHSAPDWVLRKDDTKCPQNGQEGAGEEVGGAEAYHLNSRARPSA